MQLERFAMQLRDAASTAGSDDTQISVRHETLQRDGFQFRQPFHDRLQTTTASLTLRVGKRIGFVEIEAGHASSAPVVLRDAVNRIARHGQIKDFPPLPLQREGTLDNGGEPIELHVEFEKMPDLVSGRIDWTVTKILTLSRSGDTRRTSSQSGQLQLDLVPPRLQTKQPFLRLVSSFATIDQYRRRAGPAVALAMSGLPTYADRAKFNGDVLVGAEVLERLVQLVPGLSSALNRATTLIERPAAPCDWTIWDARLLPNPTDVNDQDLLLTGVKKPPDPVTAQIRIPGGVATLATSVRGVVPCDDGSLRDDFPWQAATFAF